MDQKILIGAGVALLIGAVFFLNKGDKIPDAVSAASLKPAFAVKLPDFSGQQQNGQKKFEANCMACHGKHATGTGNGPPLIHKYYEPNHHGDAAFYRAAQNGVRSHHWRFGDMPPIKTATKFDVSEIISYIRALQRANGIY